MHSGVWGRGGYQDILGCFFNDHLTDSALEQQGQASAKLVHDFGKPERTLMFLFRLPQHNRARVLPTIVIVAPEQ